MNRGNCPYCKSGISKVHTEEITVEYGLVSLHGLAYLCHHCNSVLSVAIDPESLKEDLVSEIVARLGARGAL
jgi:uncharacterized protein with PIN domain